MFGTQLSKESCSNLIKQKLKKNKNQSPTISELLSFSEVAKLINQQDQHKHKSNKMKLIRKKQLKPQDYFAKPQLQRELMLPFQQRGTKTLKNIKHAIKNFQCFSVNKSSFSKVEGSFDIHRPDTNEDQKQHNPDNNNTKPQFQQNPTSSKRNQNQLDEILRKDLEQMIETFAMYSEVSYYSKGQLIDVSGWKRDKIKILLKGDVAIYEPTNKTALNNAIKNFQTIIKKHENNLCVEFNELAGKIDDNSYKPKKRIPQKKDSHIQVVDHNAGTFYQNEIQKDTGQCKAGTNQKIEQSFFFNMLNPSHHQNLQPNQCQQILKACHIISPLTPHKRTLILSRDGNLLAPAHSTSILNKSSQNQSSWTSICISSDAVVIQLDLIIYNQTLWLLNNNGQKLYINCLIKKFQSFGYKECKNYLKSKENIIDLLRQNESIKRPMINAFQSKKFQIVGQNLQGFIQTQTLKIDPTNLNIQNGQENGLQQQQKHTSNVNQAQDLKSHIISSYFELTYINAPYLIVQGQVTIVISKIKQQKILNENLSQPRKVYTRHQLLKLFQNDVFGIQSIGQDPEYCLRYEVRKDSKILKMSQKIIKKHLKSVSGFKEEFNLIKSQRDSLLKDILTKLNRRTEISMVQKYLDQKNNEQNASQKTIHIHQNKKIFVQPQLKPEQKNFQKSNAHSLDQELDSHARGITYSSEMNSSKNINNSLMERQSTSLPNIKLKSRSASISQSTQICSFKTRISYKSLTQRKQSAQHQQTKLKMQKINGIEYFGSKKYSEVENQVIQKLQLKERHKFRSKNQGRLTVQLLKQFNLVDFKEQTKNSVQKEGKKYAFVEMRNPFNGVLLRKRYIPWMDEGQLTKNRRKVEKVIMLKIGLLSEAQRVRHNEKVVKNRKSQIVYENLNQIQKKQQKRLLKISKSVPKLENLYSKKADILYRNLNKSKIIIG